jgi:hypothetical protein
MTTPGGRPNLGGSNVAAADTFTSTSSERPGDSAMAAASPRLIPSYALLGSCDCVHWQAGLLGDVGLSST